MRISIVQDLKTERALCFEVFYGMTVGDLVAPVWHRLLIAEGENKQSLLDPSVFLSLIPEPGKSPELRNLAIFVSNAGEEFTTVQAREIIEEQGWQAMTLRQLYCCLNCVPMMPVGVILGGTHRKHAFPYVISRVEAKEEGEKVWTCHLTLVSATDGFWPTKTSFLATCPVHTSA